MDDALQDVIRDVSKTLCGARLRLPVAIWIRTQPQGSVFYQRQIAKAIETDRPLPRPRNEGTPTTRHDQVPTLAACTRCATFLPSRPHPPSLGAHRHRPRCLHPTQPKPTTNRMRRHERAAVPVGGGGLHSRTIQRQAGVDGPDRMLISFPAYSIEGVRTVRAGPICGCGSTIMGYGRVLVRLYRRVASKFDRGRRGPFCHTRLVGR